MSSRAQAKTMRGGSIRALTVVFLLTVASLASTAAAQASDAPRLALTEPLVESNAQISGTVTAAATNGALAGIEVCAYSKFSELGGEFGERCAISGASGEYTISKLPEAEYTIEFYSLSAAYVTQYYNGRSSFLEATKVPVAEGATVSGIDAAMAVAGEITGTVTDAVSKASLENIKVCAYEIGGEFIVQCTSTGATGEYSIPRLPQGEYTVDFYSLSGSYATQYWDDEPSLATANKVAVAEGGVAGGIDAALAPAGEITGSVIEAVSEKPLENIKVCAYASGGGAAVQCTSTSSSGQYTISRLAGGEYVVEFFAVSGEYVTQYWNNKALFSEANKVRVEGGKAKSGINAAMASGGQISGTVTEANGTTPIEDIKVCAHESGGEAIVACASSSSSGEYTISRLPAAEYVVAFEALNGAYLTQYYDDKSSFSEASKVVLAGAGIASGIDAAMKPLEDAAAPANLPEAPPKIVGKAEVGAVLTCAKGTWTGNPEPIFSFQWLRDGTPIPGAASRFYSVQTVDQSHALVCEVTAANFVEAVEARTAALEIPAETPANVEAPRVYGTPSVGSIISCEPGVWTGNPKPTFTYRWLRGPVEIAGAASDVYTVQAADRGQELTCEVTGTNPAGVASAVSASVAIPAAEGSSSGSSTSSGTPVGSGSVGVQSFIAAKSSAVIVSGPITVSSGAVLVPLRCVLATGSCPAVTIKLSVVETVRSGHVTAITAAESAKTSKRTVLVGKLSVTLKAGQSETAKVVLSAAGKKLLSAHKRFAARLLVEAEGASIKTQNVTLTKPAKKH